LMSPEVKCTHCGNPFASSWTTCPHCGLPAAHFPNVSAAEAERDALNQRYADALADAKRRGTEPVFVDFEQTVGTQSRAVMARPQLVVLSLAASDHELHQTYHQRVASGARLPDDARWHILRVACEEALFLGYKERIHFAALSLGKVGLTNYGDCSVVLREELIAHRASVFEENNVLWATRRKLGVAELVDLPKGYRATWVDRGKLAATKTASELGRDTKPGDYAELLLREGATSAEDVFVEVHVYGPLTARAFEEVTFTGTSNRRGARAIERALKEKLTRFGVEIATP